MNIAREQSGPDIAIIDYGMGNLRSVIRAFEAVGSTPRLINSPDQVGRADALVFPGQGAIVDAMKLLKERCLDDTIRNWTDKDLPFFGICLGLQALFEHSAEGDTKALGILEGTVERFSLPREFKIPHMGWNQASFTGTPDGMLAGINAESEDFYFVHSYYVKPQSDQFTWATTDYGGTFTSAVRRGKLIATQFHPEKSQSKGLQLYKNFVSMI